MTPCANSQLARSIFLECDTPLNGGNTGRAVYIPYAHIATIARDSNNPRVITAITLKEGKKTVAINNATSQQPFSGSNTAGNTDSGRSRFAKVVSFMVPLRGADVSEDTIEALINDPEGGLLIVEKDDKRGLGSYEAVGLQSAAKVDPSTVNRDEYANGGAWAMSAGCTEDYAECNLYATDYATTKTLFEDLYLTKSF